MLKNQTVMLIEDIRRARLNLLIDEYGSITALAQKLDRQPAQVSQWRNASIDKATGKPRTMKSDTARRIEACTGKPDGWMDQPINDNVVDVRLSLSAYDTSSYQLTKDEAVLIAWYRKKTANERSHLLSLLGILKQPDFAQSA